MQNLTLMAALTMPFAGTMLGAASVLLMRREMPLRLQKAMTGFAAGVMTAAAVWSLLLPAIEMSDRLPIPVWMPAAVGFAAGMAFLLMLDSLVPHLHLHAEHAEGIAMRLTRTTKLVLAVTLHNIPEGMAVGVVLAGAMCGDSEITTLSALALSLGIALQNIPEGAIVSMPMHSVGNNRWRSFVWGVASGAVEPAAGVVTVLLADTLLKWMPWLLAFAAGAMLYVVVEELIPEAQRDPHSDIGTVGFAFGFLMMMILDAAL